MTKRLALPVRRQMNLTEDAYARLRELNAEYGLGNNYILTILLENFDKIIDDKALRQVFDEFITLYGAPKTGNGMGS